MGRAHFWAWSLPPSPHKVERSGGPSFGQKIFTLCDRLVYGRCERPGLRCWPVAQSGSLRSTLVCSLRRLRPPRLCNARVSQFWPSCANFPTNRAPGGFCLAACAAPRRSLRDLYAAYVPDWSMRC
eukprot:3225200-Prymnesium_polylepis.1